MKNEQMANVGPIRNIVAFVKNKENAIPLKILIYFFHGGAVCIFPFIALHMQLLGVSVKEIALVSLITPIASLLGPIANGLVADKLGRYGLVLVMNIVLMIASYDLLLAVPRVPHLTATVACDGSSILIPGCTSCFHHTLNDSLELTAPVMCESNANEEICQSSVSKVKLDIFRRQTSTQKCQFNVESHAEDFYSLPNCTTNLGSEFTIINSTTCSDDLVVPYSSSFYMFFIFRAIISFAAAAGFSMLDTSILAEAKRLDLSIGKQRVMVMLGYATTPLLSGALTDYYSASIGYQSHMPAFLVGSLFLGISAIIMSIINVRVEHNKENVLNNLLLLVQRVEVLLFLMMMLLLGINFGFIEAYLFLFMNSLGSPAIALGLTITVGCTASIPVLYFSDFIHSKISREVIYLICFTAYALRLVGYSIISNPWWALLFETLEAINYQLMWVTSLKLFPILAPKRMLATMTGLAIATHYAFGQGFGGFVGGYLIEGYGYPAAFQIMAVVSLFAGSLSFICYRFIIRKRIIEHELDLTQ